VWDEKFVQDFREKTQSNRLSERLMNSCIVLKLRYESSECGLLCCDTGDSIGVNGGYVPNVVEHIKHCKVSRPTRPPSEHWNGCENVDWTQLTKNRVLRQASVKTVLALGSIQAEDFVSDYYVLKYNTVAVSQSVSASRYVMLHITVLFLYTGVKRFR
jgi:hypothetical protein